MNYKYVPNTIDEKEIEKRGLTYDHFLELQIKYKKCFEKMLTDYVSFEELDKIIEELPFTIPVIEDNEYNFYHKFSNLNSKYIYMRNNIHIERLNDEEIKELENMAGEEVREDYMRATYERVMFEDGTAACFGTPLPQNMVDAKSIVFEFSYDEYECDILEGPVILKNFDRAFENLSETLKAKFDVKLSKLISNGFDNSLKQDNEI